MIRSLIAFGILTVTALNVNAGEILQEIRTDKLHYFLQAAFSKYGIDTVRGITAEPSGLRFKILKSPQNNNQLGAYSHFSFSGDFDVQAQYEILQLPKPNTGYGMSIGLAVHSSGAKGSVSISRSNHMEWGDCLIITQEIPKENSTNEYLADSFPTSAKRGRIGIRRVGSELKFMASDNFDVLREVKAMPFTTEPISKMRLYCDTGGADKPLDGRLYSLVIRADAINGAAIPPDSRWSWTTWLVIGSAVLTIVGIGLIIRNRKNSQYK